MSSLARRSLRTTAAVAGIAVAGVGFAAPAVAAPAPLDEGSTDGTAPAVDGGSTPNVTGDLPHELPKLFTFEGPSVYTADEAGSELPTADDLPPAPTANDLVNLGGHEQFDHMEIQTATPQDVGGAAQGLDAASMFGELTAGALGASSGNTIGD